MAYSPSADEKRIITKRAAIHAFKVGLVGLFIWSLIAWLAGWLESSTVWADLTGWIPIALAAVWFWAYRRSMLAEYASKMTALGFKPDGSI
jgi:uncharacterized membrane protein YuzA (DUF378 family)